MRDCRVVYIVGEESLANESGVDRDPSDEGVTEGEILESKLAVMDGQFVQSVSQAVDSARRIWRWDRC